MSKNIFFSLFISFFSSYIIAQASVDEVTEPADSSGILDELIDQKSDAIIKYAKQFMGVPYVWGGMSPSGFDCSGFINYVFRGFGFSLTRTSYGLAELGTTVSLKDLQPGDLMFFKARNLNSRQVGHVALVVDTTDGIIQFIHAARTGIRIDTFNNHSYYVPRYIKSKRLDYVGF
ncbi:C40 family peptidase [Crocinitomicaceae bacterium]|jgi:cell wall-associated NlpC family hydrolase|nr:C40 family peptidase [Crocinitomicaceae bacterium]